MPSPVTVTAEVAVNRASAKDVVFPSAAEIGNHKRNVPRRIIAVNAAATTRVGCKPLRLDINEPLSEPSLSLLLKF